MTQPLNPTVSKQAFDLTPIENLIKSELEYWISYLREVRSDDKPSYSEILNNSPNDTSAKTKIQALRHILETLPLRHKALASAYNTAAEFEISDQLATLIESLKDEDTQVELEGWYEKTLVKSNKVKHEVLGLEKEIMELEDGRLEELKGLMGILADVRGMIGEGYVGKEEIERLVAAMDAVGLHCDGVMRKSEEGGNGSDESWGLGRW
ncbi:hypothetical protein HII31_01745 [Pseudocercospora fuligena]|uniref:Uncharacterized protein n=1 Tax=Pseudocercospora fuligena TaxID=685502 RepID=A0A8H6VNJ5_9PEZI|nr:hypothetical protein HII31_01745 [Pseudocercospora fuligena]